jgi:hypothetical protein
MFPTLTRGEILMNLSKLIEEKEIYLVDGKFSLIPF